MPTYKVIEGEKIEKSDCTLEFELADVKAHYKICEKGLKEMTSQKELEEAKIKNYEENNAFLKDLTEEQVHVAYLHYQSNLVRVAAESKAKEYQEAIEEYKEALEDIKKQTGLV